MDTICVIPARGGSKGLPRKNIKIVGGHPLIAYPISAAFESGVCDTVFVTTDDEEIADVARQYGAQVPFLRPTSLAEDLTTTEATLKNALLSYEEHAKISFDICVFLTATDMFRRPDWVSEAVGRLKSDETLESVFSGHATHKNFWVESEDGDWERVLPWMRAYSSRQVRKPVIREDTGLSCASRAALWRDERRIGDKVEILVNHRSETGLDIHDEFDFFLVEKALEWLRSNDPRNAPVVRDPLR